MLSWFSLAMSGDSIKFVPSYSIEVHKSGHSFKFKFELQPGRLTVQVAGEHQPSKKHPQALK